MESDFAPAPEQNATRIAVLYDVGNAFECALAATIKCDACIAAIPREMSMDYAKLAEDLTACDPHSILVLGNKWNADFYATLTGKERSDEVKRLVIILARETSTPANEHVIFATPAQFAALMPTLPVISANLIVAYLMHNQFQGAITENKEELQEAAYFNTALHSQISVPFEAFNLVKNIVSDWKRVMDAEEMVAMGRYITHVGEKIATARLGKAVMITNGEQRIRVVECPDYVAIVMGQVGDIPTVAYTLSCDTTTCALTCSSKEVAEYVAATNAATIAQVEGATYFTASVATDDFFALVRKNIALPPAPPPLDPALNEAIETGARVVEFCTRNAASQMQASDDKPAADAPADAQAPADTPADAQTS